MWSQARRGGGMKAALESSRERKGNSCEHLWKEETCNILVHTQGEKEKEQRDGAAGNSTFPLISLLKT